MKEQALVWLTVREAATRARCGVKTVYREVVARRLRAARVGGRRALRFRPEWVDVWIELSAFGGQIRAEQERQGFGHADTPSTGAVHEAEW